ncbi:hypothetical protein ACROYT_G022073 [Oculina patagonica]
MQWTVDLQEYPRITLNETFLRDIFILKLEITGHLAASHGFCPTFSCIKQRNNQLRAVVLSSASFDVTLLMVLLRNICGLIPPVTGWDILPPASDVSIEADMARVKYYRNTVYGHASQASVDDVTFNAYWHDISNALVALGGASYGAAINKLKNECMDPDTEEHYRELLVQWKKDEDNIKDKLEEIEEKIKEKIEQMGNEIIEKVDSLKEPNQDKDLLRHDFEQIKTEIGDVSDKLDTLMTQKEEDKDEGSVIGILRGETLTLESRGETVTVNWIQGGFFGFGGDRSQIYVLCDYTTSSGNSVPVYIQDKYDIPKRLIIDSKLQYGTQDNVLFFVYHDKSQKPYQERFRCSGFQKFVYEANTFLKRETGIDISWVAGNYLVNV